MSCKKLLFIYLPFLAIGLTSSFAQEVVEERKQNFPISISISSHSWAFPFSNVFRFNPYYPGLSVGTEYYYLKRDKSKLFQNAEIGGFLNSSQGSAIYFNSNFGYRYTANFGLMAEVGLGLGYFHGFHRSHIYEQTPNGDYKKVVDSGVGSLSANVFTGIGYDLSKVSNRKVMPFIRYQWMGSTSYWSIIGIRPNGLLHLGIQSTIF